MKCRYFVNHPNNLIPDYFTTNILYQSNALSFHASLPVYKTTPLISLNGLARKYGVDSIYIKNEAHRFGLNAFKGLGASYAIDQILRKNPKISTFCTATDGNHGRAVAWSSSMHGKKSFVFVPKDTTRTRIEAIEGEGGKVIRTEFDYDKTCQIAAETSVNEGWQLVQDTAWEGYEEIPSMIMAGYLSIMREEENSIHLYPKPEIDLVFLQAGVGSFAAAAIWYYLYRYGHTRPKIVIVEPLEAAGILESFEAGNRISPKGTFETIMAGLNCGIPSLNSWDIIKSGADASIAIPDKYAEKAMKQLYHSSPEDVRVISGESGAAGLAGFIAINQDSILENLKEELKITKKTRILFINTEGATDPENFLRIINSKD